MDGSIDDRAGDFPVCNSPIQLTGTHEQGVVSEYRKANPNGIAQNVFCDTWIGGIS